MLHSFAHKSEEFGKTLRFWNLRARHCFFAEKEMFLMKKVLLFLAIASIVFSAECFRVDEDQKLSSKVSSLLLWNGAQSFLFCWFVKLMKTVFSLCLAGSVVHVLTQATNKKMQQVGIKMFSRFSISQPMHVIVYLLLQSPLLRQR